MLPSPADVKFEKHKKVSFFTDFKYSEFGYNQNEEVFALDDEWIMNEPEMELIRLYKRGRHRGPSYSHLSHDSTLAASTTWMECACDFALLQRYWLPEHIGHPLPASWTPLTPSP